MEQERPLPGTKSPGAGSLRAIVTVGAADLSGQVADLLADIDALIPEPPEPSTTERLAALVAAATALDAEAAARVITEDQLGVLDDWLEDIASLVEANGYGSEP